MAGAMQRRAFLVSFLVALLTWHAECVGFMLVGDMDTSCILKFSTSGEFLGEFVKRRSGGLKTPGGFAFFQEGNKTDGHADLHVASTGSNAVLRFDGESGRFLRVTCRVKTPQDLLFHDGVLYVATGRHGAILRFRGKTGAPLGVLAEGPPMAFPAALSLRANSMLVASRYNGKVLSFDVSASSWRCPWTQSPCSKPPKILNKKPLSSIMDFALGGSHSIYAVGPRLGAIYRLNATGDYFEHFEHEAITTRSPFGVAYLNGHLFVSVEDAILRFNGITGEYYGSFASHANVLSRPNKLMWV